MGEKGSGQNNGKALLGMEELMSTTDKEEAKVRETKAKDRLKAIYDGKEVVSAMIKELRKGDFEKAAYWAYILYQTMGFISVVRHLYLFAAEDTVDLELITYLGTILLVGEKGEWLQDRHSIWQAVMRFVNAPKKWNTVEGHQIEQQAEKSVVAEVKALGDGKPGRPIPRHIPSYAFDRYTTAGWELKRAGIPFDVRLSGADDGGDWRRHQFQGHGELPEIEDRGEVNPVYRKVSKSYQQQKALGFWSEDDE